MKSLLMLQQQKQHISIAKKTVAATKTWFDSNTYFASIFDEAKKVYAIELFV